MSKYQEDRLQQECYMAFHNLFPQYRGLLCYNLNNVVPCKCPKGKKLAMIEGSKNKAMGLQEGRSDLVFYFGGKSFMFECKTDSGRQSPNQKEWQRLIEGQGFDYIIFRSKEEFLELINAVIKKGTLEA